MSGDELEAFADFGSVEFTNCLAITVESGDVYDLSGAGVWDILNGTVGANVSAAEGGDEQSFWVTFLLDGKADGEDTDGDDY